MTTLTFFPDGITISPSNIKPTLKLENMEVLTSLRKLRDSNIFISGTNDFNKIYNYIAEIEEKNRLLVKSNKEFLNIVAELDPELKAYLDMKNAVKN